ncbi:MAG: hypothetical protein ACE148_14280 [Vicinamibacterales bacterium]
MHNRASGDSPQPEAQEGASESRTPRFRPREGFWPYVDLPEQPTEEEMAALDPDLRAALFGSPPLPFSVTIRFPPFDGPGYERAVKIARESAEYREIGPPASRVHLARFWPSDAARLRALWQVVGGLDSADVLIDDRPVPYARELWLPLFWFLVPPS